MMDMATASTPTCCSGALNTQPASGVTSSTPMISKQTACRMRSAVDLMCYLLQTQQLLARRRHNDASCLARPTGRFHCAGEKSAPEAVIAETFQINLGPAFGDDIGDDAGRARGEGPAQMARAGIEEQIRHRTGAQNGRPVHGHGPEAGPVCCPAGIHGGRVVR